jgi:ketosteroid isomerase-like protein
MRRPWYYAFFHLEGISMKKFVICSMLAITPIFLFSSLAITQTNEEETVKAAWASIENFFVAFNNEDNEELQKYMTFPHMFLNRNGSVRVSEERWDMNFEAMKERQDWVKSTLDSHEATMVFEDKVHFRIVFGRVNSKGEKYYTKEGVYIATKKDGKWGLQVRSY